MLEEDLVLAFDSPVIDRLEFYFIKDRAVVRTSLAGDTIPFSQLDYPYRIPVIPFEIANKGGANENIFSSHIVYRRRSTVNTDNHFSTRRKTTK